MTARIIGVSPYMSGVNATSIAGEGIPAPTPLVTREDDIRDGLLLLNLNGWDGASGTITQPSGFSAITGITNGPTGDSAVTLGCFTKTASSETGFAYEMSWVNSEWLSSLMLLIDGWSSIDIAAAADGNDAAPIAPSVTTTVDDCLVIRGFVCDVPGSTISPIAQNDGSLALLHEMIVMPTEGGRAAIMAGAHRKAAAGATGTFTFSIGTAEQWRAFTIAVAPSGKPGGMSGIEVGL